MNFAIYCMTVEILIWKPINPDCFCDMKRQSRKEIIKISLNHNSSWLSTVQSTYLTALKFDLKLTKTCFIRGNTIPTNQNWTQTHHFGINGKISVNRQKLLKLICYPTIVKCFDQNTLLKQWQIDVNKTIQYIAFRKEWKVTICYSISSQGLLYINIKAQYRYWSKIYERLLRGMDFFLFFFSDRQFVFSAYKVYTIL
jgi:hypothetical protein